MPRPLSSHFAPATLAGAFALVVLFGGCTAPFLHTQTPENDQADRILDDDGGDSSAPPWRKNLIFGERAPHAIRVESAADRQN